MCPRKSASFYSADELAAISVQWCSDKARIDADPAFAYYYDRDREYERHLANGNLKMLFRNAAYLRRRLLEGNGLKLYPDEKPLIADVYKGILKNGYFSRSKETERKVRAWLGKTVSRQYRPRRY